MEPFSFINAILSYVETRVKGKIDYDELTKTTGYSLPYLRELFACQMNKSLSRYVLERKIANAAFECAYTDKSFLHIGSEYGLDNPDSFTRAFRRIVGVTPTEFRKRKITVKRTRLCASCYGIELPVLNDPLTRGGNHMETPRLDQDEAILLGVPQVQYGPESLTPFPCCLKACANYIGIDVSYDYVMAASGAAFRLTWDETGWNLGNVDAIFTYDDPVRVFRQGIEALGCHFQILWREKDTPKSAFISFIKNQINKGNPVIALGIIGPPEACIITGYRNDGETLLGWNFFQNNSEFSGSITFDDSGYFVTEHWWDNPETLAVMSLEPGDGNKANLNTMIGHAVEAMTGRKHGNYAKGLLAYDAWMKAVANDKDFSDGLVLPLLAERLFTHDDAIDCLLDGRYQAAVFLNKAAEQYPEHKSLFEQAAKHFMAVYELHAKLFEVLGGWERGEAQMRQLAQSDVRKQTVQLIHQAKESDEKAYAILKQLAEVV